MESNKGLIKWMRQAAWIMFIVIIGYLLIASIFSTCYIGKLEYFTDMLQKTTEINVEHTYYIRDSWWIHLLIFALFSCLLVNENKTPKCNRSKRYSLYICILAGVIAFGIVITGQLVPKFDQKHIIELATAFSQKDFSALQPGGYLYKYPYQIGIVTFYQILSLIFGNLNYVAFEMVNVFFIIITYYILCKISRILWSDNVENITAIVCLCFLPYLFYATFLYGTVVGLFFAVLSFYLVLLFHKNPNVLYALGSSICMALAIICKSNYLIFMIAAIIYLFFSGIEQVKKNIKIAGRSLLFIVLLLFFYIISDLGTSKYLRELSDGEELQGVPMSSFVALGLQDGKSAPGWHNNYDATVWMKNNYDYDLAVAESKEEIRKIVSKYPQNISSSVSFFVKKIESQWNNPTFQSIWILEDRDGKEGLNWLCDGLGRYVYETYVNILQTWIQTGVFLYAILRFKRNRWEELIIPITFIGGFLFHILWEAKTIYAMPFFLLLLPLCVCGYKEWRTWLLEQKEMIQTYGLKSENTKKLKRKITIGGVVIAVICLLSYTDTFAKLFARNEDTGIFNVYTQDMVNKDILLLEEKS